MDMQKHAESLKLYTRRGYYVKLKYFCGRDGAPLNEGYMGKNSWDLPLELDLAFLVPLERKDEVTSRIKEVISRYERNETLEFEFIPVIETTTLVTQENEVGDAQGNDIFREHNYTLQALTNSTYQNLKDRKFLESLRKHQGSAVDMCKAIEKYMTATEQNHRKNVVTGVRLDLMDIVDQITFN